ncbi:hypothetical protein [Rhodococcus sp. NPDC003348]
MSETVMFGSEHERCRELSDWLQSITSDLSDDLGAVELEARAATCSRDGAASNTLLAVVDTLEASGHHLIEALRSVTAALRQAAWDFAAHDSFAAMSLFGS